MEEKRSKHVVVATFFCRFLDISPIYDVIWAIVWCMCDFCEYFLYFGAFWKSDCRKLPM